MALSFDRMLLAWARKQPADAEYDYGAVDNCALCRFLRDTGLAESPRVGGFTWRDRALPGISYRPISKPVATALTTLDDRLEAALAQ